MKSTDFKICDVIIIIPTKWKLQLCLFLLNPISPIEMKLGQILVCCLPNISNMFLAQAEDWKLVPGPFMILLKYQ